MRLFSFHFQNFHGLLRCHDPFSSGPVRDCAFYVFVRFCNLVIRDIVEEVGQLAMSSKVMTAHIVKYITSEEFTSKFVRTASGPTDLSIQVIKFFES